MQSTHCQSLRPIFTTIAPTIPSDAHSQALLAQYIAHDEMDTELVKKILYKIDAVRFEDQLLENLQFAQALPPAQRLKTLSEAECLDSLATQDAIVCALGQLLKTEDPSTYAYLEERLDRYKNSPESIPPISKAIDKCSYTALESALYDVLSEKCKAAHILLQIPSDRHDRLYNMAKGLYPDVSGCTLLIAIVAQALCKLDDTDIADLQECIAPFVPVVPTLFRFTLLTSLQRLELNKRHLVSKALLKVFKAEIVSKASQDDIEQAVLILQDIPENTVLKRVKATISFLQKHECPLPLETLAQLTSCLDLSSPDADVLKPLLTSLRSSRLLELFRLLEFLPPDVRLPALRKIDIKGFDIELLIQECIMDTTFIPKKTMYQFLQQMLEEHVGKKRLADFYAGSIINCIDLLSLEDSDPLLQRAIEVHVISNDCEEINPYTLHKEFQREQENPPLDPATLTLKHTEHLGHKLCLDIAGIRAQAKKKWPPTRADLAQGISPDTLDTLFTALEKRIAQQDETQRYIQKHYGANLIDLKAHLLQLPLIRCLLRITCDPEAKVEHAHVQLFAILQALLSCTNEVHPGALLSEREEFLLSFSKQLRKCIYGQRDGLHIIYNSLVYKKMCTATLSFDSDFEGEYITAIHEHIQTQMNLALTSAALIKQLSGEYTSAQVAHQTLYLKNRFCSHLGLKHTLCFDPHIFIVPASLRKIPTKESLEHIVNSIDVVSLVLFMQDYITRLLAHSEKKEVLYNTLYDLFKTIQNKPDDWQQQWLSFDDDFLFTGITKEGAICLLIHARAIIVR